jgi:NAD+ diphosphatase
MPLRPDLGPKPRLGYAENRLERAAERRRDAAALDAMLSGAKAGAYVIGGEMILAKKGAPLSDPLFTLAEARALAPTTETVFLGHLDEAGHFAFGIAPEAAEALKARDDLLITDLRSIAVQGLVDAEHLPPIAEGKAVLHWHAKHRFCSNCGAPTRVPIRSSSCWRSTVTIACSAAHRASRRPCGRASPVSSSPANHSRMPCIARPARKPALFAAR